MLDGKLNLTSSRNSNMEAGKNATSSLPTPTAAELPRKRQPKEPKGTYKGWLLKKATSLSAYISWSGWRRRFCVIRDNKLEYFTNPTDLEPRGAMLFGADCKVMYEGVVKEKFYSFNIVIGEPGRLNYQVISFAAESYELAQRWITVIDAKIRSAAASGQKDVIQSSSVLIDTEESDSDKDGNETEIDSDNEEIIMNIANTGGASSKKRNQFHYFKPVRGKMSVRIKSIEANASRYNLFFNENWKLHSLVNDFRIFQQIYEYNDIQFPLPMKIQGVINTSPARAFRILMDISKSRSRWDNMMTKGKIVELHDDHSDVIQVECKLKNTSIAGLSIIPVKKRIFKLDRYWRSDSDGSYVILYRSTGDSDKENRMSSNTGNNVVFANVYWSAVVISPHYCLQSLSGYNSSSSAIHKHCIISYGLHADLKGWLPMVGSYASEPIADMLSTITSLKECIENDAAFDVEDVANVDEIDVTTCLKHIRSKSVLPHISISLDLDDQVAAERGDKTKTKTKIKNDKASMYRRASETMRQVQQAADAEHDKAVEVEKSYLVQEVELNYDYDIPENNFIIPMKLSLDGVSAWWDSGVEKGFWKVRGPNYLRDKVKVPNETSAMELLQIQWSFFDEPKTHISADPGELIQQQHVGRKDRPFMFVINFMVPSIGNWACYFCKRRGVEDKKFDRMLQQFIDGDDEYRNSRFKIIPSVVEGYYIVRKGVGNKPAILGKKIDTEYYRGDNYFEVCINVGSSRVAGSLMGLVKGYATSLVIDLAFLFESQTDEELPERILGGCRMHFPCMDPKQPPKSKTTA